MGRKRSGAGAGGAGDNVAAAAAGAPACPDAAGGAVPEAVDAAPEEGVPAADGRPTPPRIPPATSEATRRSMQGNRSKNTKPELLVRSYLRAAGLTGYRLQWKREFGRPDVAFPGRRVAIFVHGCFWHRCPYCHPSEPRSNTEFWEAKFRRNRERDERHTRALLDRGWTVIVVWECRLKKKRVRRTMGEVVAEVRIAEPVRVKADERPGKLVVLGRTCVRGPRGLAAERVRARRRCDRDVRGGKRGR